MDIVEVGEMIIMMLMMIPILMTLEGIVTDTSDVHDSKADSPNDNDEHE